MALIKHGSFGDFAANVSPDALESLTLDKSVEILDTVGVLEEATRPAQTATIQFPVSAEARGLVLKSMMFKEGFEGFLSKIFSGESEVYFLSWAYDLSGAPATLHPPSGVAAEDVVRKARPNEILTYLGDGALLFPARKVSSGIALRIQLWESDAGARRLGDTLKATADEISKSELNQLLKLIALAGGPTTATLGMIEEAAVELTKAIGIILKTNSEDFVDFYEGYFSATSPWSKAEEKGVGPHSEIVIGKLTG